jgi:hypothetical protein
MDLSCPHCGRAYPTADISLDLGVALCRSCDVATDLHTLRKTAPVPQSVLSPAALFESAALSSAALSSAVVRPESITEEVRGPDLELSYRWFSPIAFFLVFFLVAWDSFLVFWYASAVGIGSFTGGGGFGLFAGLFALPHTAVGLGLTYFTVALFVNRTILRVGSGRVAVHHGPLPWRGNLERATRGVSGLRVLERESSGGRNRNRTITWDVHLVQDGVSVPLLTGLDEHDKARFFAERVGRELGVGVS